jgi:hypothetical protein
MNKAEATGHAVIAAILLGAGLLFPPLFPVGVVLFVIWAVKT